MADPAGLLEFNQPAPGLGPGALFAWMSLCHQDARVVDELQRPGARFFAEYRLQASPPVSQTIEAVLDVHPMVGRFLCQLVRS